MLQQYSRWLQLLKCNWRNSLLRKITYISFGEYEMENSSNVYHFSDLPVRNINPLELVPSSECFMKWFFMQISCNFTLVFWILIWEVTKPKRNNAHLDSILIDGWSETEWSIDRKKQQFPPNSKWENFLFQILIHKLVFLKRI